jgi:hypothetical protein
MSSCNNNNDDDNNNNNNNNNNNGAARGRQAYKTLLILNTTLVRKKSHKETCELPCAANFTHIACISLILVLRFRAPAEKVEHKTKNSSTQKMAPTQNPETITPQKEPCREATDSDYPPNYNKLNRMKLMMHAL